MRATFHVRDDIEVKSNLRLTLRERGKIVARREGHNIWLNTGRQYIAELLAYKQFAPDLTQRDDRIKYMGLGIGGTRQLATATADAYPMTDYGLVGAFTQTDLDPAITKIERPVRVSGAVGVPVAGDAWLSQVGAPPSFATLFEVTFSCAFTQLQVSYAIYNTVPLSEIGLFTSLALPNQTSNIGSMVAYDTFDTLSKTLAVELEVLWTLKN
jgi:hypothetical protein